MEIKENVLVAVSSPKHTLGKVVSREEKEGVWIVDCCSPVGLIKVSENFLIPIIELPESDQKLNPEELARKCSPSILAYLFVERQTTWGSIGSLHKDLEKLYDSVRKIQEGLKQAVK